MVIADDELSKDNIEQLHDLFDFSVEWMKDYLKQLKVGPFTKGKDVKQPKQYTKQMKIKLQTIYSQLNRLPLKLFVQCSKHLNI